LLQQSQDQKAPDNGTQSSLPLSQESQRSLLNLLLSHESHVNSQPWVQAHEHAYEAALNGNPRPLGVISEV